MVRAKSLIPVVALSSASKQRELACHDQSEKMMPKVVVLGWTMLDRIMWETNVLRMPLLEPDSLAKVAETA